MIIDRKRFVCIVIVDRNRYSKWTEGRGDRELLYESEPKLMTK